MFWAWLVCITIVLMLTNASYVDADLKSRRRHRERQYGSDPVKLERGGGHYAEDRGTEPIRIRCRSNHPLWYVGYSRPRDYQDPQAIFRQDRWRTMESSESDSWYSRGRRTKESRSSSSSSSRRVYSEELLFELS